MLYVSKSEIWSKIQIFVRFLGLKTLVPANFTSARIRTFRMQRQVRIKKELALETKNPSPGISVWLPDEDNIEFIDGLITGPEDSPFSGGCFKVKITLPER